MSANVLYDDYLRFGQNALLLRSSPSLRLGHIISVYAVRSARPNPDGSGTPHIPRTLYSIGVGRRKKSLLNVLLNYKHGKDKRTNRRTQR